MEPAISRFVFAALVATPLVAQARAGSADSSAAIGGGYGNFKSDGQSVDGWNIAGAALIPLGGPGLNHAETPEH